MLQSTILGFVRHILTFGGGFLVAKGYLDDASLSELIGAVITLAGGVWSAVDKKGR